MQNFVQFGKQRKIKCQHQSDHDKNERRSNKLVCYLFKRIFLKKYRSLVWLFKQNCYTFVPPKLYLTFSTNIDSSHGK